MKVAFVSTYPPAPCGIGDYTRELRLATERADPNVQIEVVAERHASVTSELDPNVERAWRRGGGWDRAAAEAVIRRKPALVHVQHEEAILGQDGRFIRFLRAVGQAGIKRVVTLHSVYGGRLGLPFWWPPPLFHRAIAAESEAIVVHQQEGGRDYLERQGVAAQKIHVIAHGTPSLPEVDRAAARRALGLPTDARVALFFGVIHPKKNVHTIVRAAELARRQVKALRLVIAGRARQRTVLDRLYARRLDRVMRAGIDAGWLDHRPGFLPAAEIPAYLAAADAVLFPHDQRYGSASGVFHLALGAGRATICSSSPKFGEAREIFAEQMPGAFARARDAGAWASAMTALLASPELCRKGDLLAREAAGKTAWSVIGKSYARLYAALDGGPGSDGRRR